MYVRKRKVWEQPWGHVEGFLIAVGVALAGTLMQIVSGGVDTELFAYPVNLIIGTIFTLSIVIVYYTKRSNNTIKWLSGVQATTTLLVILIVFLVIMGILPQIATKQQAHQHNSTPIFTLGWNRMTTSWTFILLCFYMLNILGLVILRRATQKQTWRNIGFYLNHLGLYIALLGGILGSADIERLTMTVTEGNTEWRAQDSHGEIRELPIAIQLDTFLIDEYNPKIVVIDNNSGKILPEKRPESYMFEGVGKKTRIAGVDIEITDYVAHAAIIKDPALTKVVPMVMEGTAPAIKVKAMTSNIDKPVEGWISCGSYIFPHNVLYLNEQISLAMPPQEVKHYTSKVTVYTEKGNKKEAAIEVNKPLSIEEWAIYQYSYDKSRGKYSETSIFELVRDPWLAVVFTGIIMLLFGAVYLFVTGPNKQSI